MKKELIILSVLCFVSLLLIIPASAAGEINYPLGVQNTQINVTFDNGSNFSSSEINAIMAAAGTWENTGYALQTARKPVFNHKNGYNISDGVSFKKGYLSGSTVANCAFKPTSNEQMLKSSHITFTTNSAYDWTTNIGNAEWGVWDVQSIALHELGHSLGLGHISDNQAVMFPETPDYGKRTLDVWDEYYFYQIYKNQAVGRKSVNDENISFLDDEYWESRGIVTEAQENYLNLRSSPSVTENTYDIELGMDIFYVPLSDDQMVEYSDLIIKGVVKEISLPWWNTSDGSIPLPENMLEYSLFHDVIVEVDTIYKGNLENTSEIVVRQVGGELGSVRQTTSVPQFYEGESVLLYLIKEQNPNNSDGSEYYTLINEKGQLFVINDNLAINGFGQKVML